MHGSEWKQVPYLVSEHPTLSITWPFRVLFVNEGEWIYQLDLDTWAVTEIEVDPDWGDCFDACTCSEQYIEGELVDSG